MVTIFDFWAKSKIVYRSPIAEIDYGAGELADGAGELADAPNDQQTSNL